MELRVFKLFTQLACKKPLVVNFFGIQGARTVEEWKRFDHQYY